MDNPAIKPKRPPGCPECGLFGCDCNEVQDTFSALLCRVCRQDPCLCGGAVKVDIKLSQHGEVCQQCRRAHKGCICESHFSPRHVEDVNANSTRVQRPYPASYVESLANEAMLLFNARDAQGLYRWLLRKLP